MQYPIVEIFQSIQGEGDFIGKPCNFIRVAGCNLNCPWCDTDWKKAKAGILTEQQILSKLDFELPFTVITGGEPLLYDWKPLLKYFADAGHSAHFETNGTQPNKDIWYDFDIFVSVSPKPQAKWLINPLCKFDELKFVMDEDITFENITNISPLGMPIWLQPLGQDMQKSWKKCYEFAFKGIKKGYDMRVGLQLHKLMEVR